MLNKYKIDPTTVNMLRKRYPALAISFLVNGQVSEHPNETKADGLMVIGNGKEYRVSWLRVSERDVEFELTEIGTVMDKVLGNYSTEVGAIARIAELASV